MRRKTVLHDREVSYTVKKSARARRLRVAVYCDASVVVTVPADFGESKIEKFLKEKAGWILEKIKEFGRMEKEIHLRGGKREFKKYRIQALAFVIKKVEELNRQYNFSYSRITVKNQKTRWGSCSKKRNLNFNYKIIFLPEKLAEYIIVHELCHLQEFNHSQKFWNLVARAVPNYRDVVKQVKRHIL